MRGATAVPVIGDADPLVDVRPQREDVQPRVVQRSAEDHRAALDLAASGCRPRRCPATASTVPFEREPAVGRGKRELAAQQGVEAAAAQPQRLPEVERHVDVDARGRRPRAVGPTSVCDGRRLAQHGHVVAECRRAAAAEVDQALVDVDVAVDGEPLRIELQRRVAARDDAPIDAPEHQELVGDEPQRRCAASRRTVASPLDLELAVAGARPQLDDLRSLALAARSRARRRAGRCLRAGCAGRARCRRSARCTRARRSGRRTTRSRAARRAAASRPAPRRPRRRGRRSAAPARPAAAHRRVARSRVASVRNVTAPAIAPSAAAGQRLREVPDAVAGVEREAQVGQLERAACSTSSVTLRSPLLAPELDVGDEARRAVNIDPAGDDQVAAPAELGLQAGQQRRDAEGLDLGLARRAAASRRPASAACSSAAPRFGSSARPGVDRRRCGAARQRVVLRVDLGSLCDVNQGAGEAAAAALELQAAAAAASTRSGCCHAGSNCSAPCGAQFGQRAGRRALASGPRRAAGPSTAAAAPGWRRRARCGGRPSCLPRAGVRLSSLRCVP